MTLRKLPLFFSIGIISFTTQLSAQTITLEAFLDQLQKRHPVFEKERLTAQIEQEDQNSNFGMQDWILFTSVSLSRETPAIAFAGPKRTDAVTLSGGVERLFWKTGGRLIASFTSGRAYLDIDPVFGFPDAFYQNQFAVTYAHPLLKNRGGFLDKFQYELKQFDIDFSEVRALENQEDFLSALASKFLDWVFLREQMKIVTERLGLSEEELERTRRKREANLVDEVDVIRAEDAVRVSKQNQVLVDSQLNAVRAELAVLSQDNELNTADPEYALYDVVELNTLESATSQVKENSRLIKAINIRIKQIAYNRRGFEETRKPDLSLVAQVNTKSVDTALGESFVLDKPDLVVWLRLSVPLENRTAKSQITKTDLQVKQIQLQLEEISLDLASAVTNIYIQIEELKKVMTLNQEQIQSAKRKTEEELKLYNQGRGELTFVIQSRDSEQNAKLTYAQNAVTYHKLLIEYRAIMDQLL